MSFGSMVRSNHSRASLSEWRGLYPHASGLVNCGKIGKRPRQNSICARTIGFGLRHPGNSRVRSKTAQEPQTFTIAGTFMRRSPRAPFPEWGVLAFRPSTDEKANSFRLSTGSTRRKYFRRKSSPSRVVGRVVCSICNPVWNFFPRNGAGLNFNRATWPMGKSNFHQRPASTGPPVLPNTVHPVSRLCGANFHELCQSIRPAWSDAGTCNAMACVEIA